MAAQVAISGDRADSGFAGERDRNLLPIIITLDYNCDVGDISIYGDTWSFPFCYPGTGTVAEWNLHLAVPAALHGTKRRENEGAIWHGRRSINKNEGATWCGPRSIN